MDVSNEEGYRGIPLFEGVGGLDSAIGPTPSGERPSDTSVYWSLYFILSISVLPWLA